MIRCASNAASYCLCNGGVGAGKGAMQTAGSPSNFLPTNDNKRTAARLTDSPRPHIVRRILFVSCNYASDYGPMVWGTYLRMRMLLEGATRAAQAVDLLLFAAPDVLPSVDPTKIAASLKTHWGLDVAVYVEPRFTGAHRGSLATLRGLFDLRHHQDYGDAGGPEQARAVASALKPDTDLVIAHRLDASLAVVAGVAGSVPVAINFDDIEHVARSRRMARWAVSARTLLGSFEVGTLRRTELAVLRRSQCALVCSRGERDYLASLGVTTSIAVIHNAVAFPIAIRNVEPPGRTIMFIGSYGYEPNIEAAEELITKIFPRVASRVPGARLLIAGARSERLPSARQTDPAIEILGFIDDIAEIYSRASVACCAIRAGGGTRIKIIEAAAWQVPTVSTVLGAEGLDLDDGNEILIAESSAQLADACVRLLQDPALAAAIGAAACAKVARSYERDAVIDQIANRLRATSEAFVRANPNECSLPVSEP